MERVRWLDIGGGDGTLARGVLARATTVDADVYNLPALRPLVERTGASVRASARKDGAPLGVVGGDFLREDLPQGYDVLSFVRVLHDWPNDVSSMLLRKAFAALPPGGRLIVCEEMRDAERLAIQFFWSYFLIGLDNCVSRLRDGAFYLRALEETGFRDCRLLPGPFDIVIATRPGARP